MGDIFLLMILINIENTIIDNYTNKLILFSLLLFFFNLEGITAPK